MKKRIMFILVAVLATTAVSWADDFHVVTMDRGNSEITRWHQDGTGYMWQVPHNNRSYRMEVGPDGNIYLGGFTDDRTWQINPVNGNITAVAHQQTPVTDRNWGLTFGNDIDSDGIDDLYVTSGTNGYVLAYGSASGYAGTSEVIFADLSAVITRRTVALDFGPDINSDGVADMWVTDGDGNDGSNYCIIVDGATGAAINTFAISETRAPQDLVIDNGRVVISSAANKRIVTYALDGSDPNQIVEEHMYYGRDIHKGLDGKWYMACRFGGGGTKGEDLKGTVQVFNADWTWDSTFIAADPSQDFAGVVTIVPEPATMMLLGLGSLALIRRKK